MCANPGAVDGNGFAGAGRHRILRAEVWDISRDRGIESAIRRPTRVRLLNFATRRRLQAGAAVVGLSLVPRSNVTFIRGGLLLRGSCCVVVYAGILPDASRRLATNHDDPARFVCAKDPPLSAEWIGRLRQLAAALV